MRDANGDPINLQGATVRFRMEPHVDAEAEVVDAAEGKVRYEWQDGDTDVVGIRYAEFSVTFLAGGRQTVPNDGYVYVEIKRALG